MTVKITTIRATFIIFLAIVLLLVGASQAQNQENATTLRIGMLIRQGTAADLGARLAVAEINETGFAGPDGQTYRLELIYPSSLSTADQLPSAMSGLVDQGARALIGPADETLALPNLEPMARAGVPVLTLATTDALTDLDVTNNIMRMRAAESFYSSAAAEYLAQDLGISSIALVQTDVESTEALITFDLALEALGVTPIRRIQLVDNTNLEAELPALISDAPGAVAMWGPPQDVNTVLGALRGSGWDGAFFYRNALEASISDNLNANLINGMYGINGWTYTAQTALSRQFLVDYVSAYGEVPPDSAAAAYDAVYVFRGQVAEAGPDMPDLYESLLETPLVFTVQGRLNPTAYGNGDFSRTVYFYQLGEFGGPNLLARYENGIRLPEDDLLVEDADPIALIGTPTFTPTITPTPSTTPTLTTTPSQLQLTATAVTEVYDGPGDFFTSLGQLQAGEAVTILGGNQDLTWLVVQYRGGIGWIANSTTIEIFDPNNILNQIPIFDSPPTPVGGVTPTLPFATSDIVITNVDLLPDPIIPGQSFLANVTVQNIGSSSTGAFTLAATFQPGGIYTSNLVSNIDAGASIVVPLSGVLLGTGDYAVDVVADIDNTVTEGGDSGELNNTFRVVYRVDYPIIIEATNVPAFAGNDILLTGIAADINWTGTDLNAINNARLGIITTATFDTLHYDQLQPAVISAVTITDAQILPGVLIGVITAEGQRGVIRIEARAGTALTISYKVYSN